MYQLTQNHPSKRAFITGAASGLGKAFCQELSKDGWTIGMADINTKELEAAAAEIEMAGGKPLMFPLDVSDKDQYKLVAEEFLTKAGGIDLLFNNAGVGDGSLFEEYNIENYEWMVGINQMGVVHGCWYFIPAMKKQASGHIINTASAAAIGCERHTANSCVLPSDRGSCRCAGSALLCSSGASLSSVRSATRSSVRAR